ncbi:MAG TPA: hypothetical protein VG758_12390 [Hyphomicrobiaceae bacterium]|jgi:hypothetical protein|nr:hypothetical protein [Hyphomicrobiaceae bacterium]
MALFLLSTIVMLAILAAPLVGLQIVMTRLYGWRGLAYTTTVLVLLILAVPGMLIAWLSGRFGSVPRPSELTYLPRPSELINLVNVFPASLPLAFLVPPFIVLVTFLLLALTVKK